MIRRLALALVALGITQFAFSQSDFRKGFIITNSRDTIEGLINYHENFKSYEVCDFKKSKDQSAVSYKPFEILGYGFTEGRFYEAKSVTVNNLPVKPAFLEVLVKGIVSLYKFQSRFLLEKDSTDLRVLSNELEEVFVGGRKMIRRSNQHISTLNTFMYDCFGQNKLNNNATLNEKSLTRIVEHYHKCKGLSFITYKTEKPWLKPTIGLAVGGSTSQIEFTADRASYNYLTRSSFVASKSTSIGISFDVSSPRLSERFSFHSNFLFSSPRYYLFDLAQNNFSIERNYVAIEMEELKIPISLRYTLPKIILTPYFDAGVSTTLHLKTSTSWIQEVEMSNIVEITKSEALTTKKSQFGLWAGFGLSKSISRKLEVYAEFRFEVTNGISKEMPAPFEINSKITNLQLITGIRLK